MNPTPVGDQRPTKPAIGDLRPAAKILFEFLESRNNLENNSLETFINVLYKAYYLEMDNQELADILLQEEIIRNEYEEECFNDDSDDYDAQADKEFSIYRRAAEKAHCKQISEWLVLKGIEILKQGTMLKHPKKEGERVIIEATTQDSSYYIRDKDAVYFKPIKAETAVVAEHKYFKVLQRINSPFTNTIEADEILDTIQLIIALRLANPITSYFKYEAEILDKKEWFTEITPDHESV